MAIWKSAGAAGNCWGYACGAVVREAVSASTAATIGMPMTDGLLQASATRHGPFSPDPEGSCRQGGCVCRCSSASCSTPRGAECGAVPEAPGFKYTRVESLQGVLPQSRNKSPR